MFAGGCPGDGRWRKASRGRRGRRPLRLAREWAAAEACPSSGPAGPPSPKGEGKGCCWRRREVAAGWGHPALRMGDMETLWGLRGHPFPGRRTVGAGHARPGGWREHPSMVRSVGRGLDPSAGDCPGDGCWRKVSRGVGDAAPYELPGNGWQRKPAPHPALRGHLPPRGKARVAGEGFIPPGVLAAAEGRGGVGAPRPTYGGIWKRLRGLRGHPFPGRRTVGAGHARPGGWREHPSMVRSVGRGLDPSAGDCPGDGCWRKVSRGVGDAAPYELPGNGWQRKPAPHPALRGHLPPRGKARVVVGGDGRSRRGGGTPPYGWGIWKRCGVYAGTRSRAAAR